MAPRSCSSSEWHFGASTPAVLLATNLVTNPSFETALTPWTGSNATLSRVSTDRYSGSYGLQLVNTGNPPAAVVPADGLLAGRIYTMSAWVKCTQPGGTVAFVTLGGLGGTSPAYAVTGTWQRIVHTFTSLADGIGRDISIRFTPAGTPAAGALVCHIDSVMVTEAGRNVPYFDGDIAPTREGGFFRWEGTPHASTSTWWTAAPTPPPSPTGTLWSEESFEVAPGDLIAVEGHMGELPGAVSVSTVLNTNLITNPSMESGTTVPTGIAYSGNGDGVRSTAWKENGAVSLELYGKAGGNTDSWAYVQGNNFTAGGAGNVLRPGKSYYLSATVRLAAPLTGTLGGLALRLHVWHNNGVTGTNVYSTPAPNVAGVYRLEMWVSISTDAVWRCSGWVTAPPPATAPPSGTRSW